eukprot:COSAG01_NODE_3869_length_5605_cov_39.512713_1_plen_161_part_00
MTYTGAAEKPFDTHWRTLEEQSHRQSSCLDQTDSVAMAHAIHRCIAYLVQRHLRLDPWCRLCPRTHHNLTGGCAAARPSCALKAGRANTRAGCGRGGRGEAVISAATVGTCAARPPSLTDFTSGGSVSFSKTNPNFLPSAPSNVTSIIFCRRPRTLRRFA